MERSRAGSYAAKRFFSVVIVSAMLLEWSGCGLEALVPQTLEEPVALSGISERELALEEMDRKASQYLEGTAGANGPADDLADRGGAEALVSGAGSCQYAYEKLNEVEQLWYSDMVFALGTMTDKVKLSEEGIEAGLDENDVDKIFQSVQSDHPEFFYVEGYSYTKYTREEKVVAIEFSGSYSLDRDGVLLRRDRIEEAAERILAEAPDGADDYGKTKYVYETLILNTEYDLEAADNQNIYSVFVNHVSVCQGYAKAVQYLLNRMGVECMLVQGVVMETGESHAWNLAKLDGEYYYLDATWGDISYLSPGEQRNEELLQIGYDYLNITTDQLLITHRIEGVIEMPVCTAEKNNYYVREGAMFETYDREQFQDLVDRVLAQNRTDISLRCKNEDCYDRMRNALVEEQEIFDFIRENEAGSFAYTTNEKQLTMTFFMMTNK